VTAGLPLAGLVRRQMQRCSKSSLFATAFNLDTLRIIRLEPYRTNGGLDKGSQPEPHSKFVGCVSNLFKTVCYENVMTYFGGEA